MLFCKLDEMSIGPLWLLRAKPTTCAVETRSDALCSVCGEAWLQSTDKDSSVIVVLASPLTEEVQHKLLKNCLAAAGWFSPSIFSLHATCSADMTASLTALNEQIAVQSPELIIVFGLAAAQHINPEFISGKVHHFANTRLLVTYHPSEMIATPALKAQVWADLCLVYSGNE